MDAFSAFTIFLGAGLGALLRWILGHFLNPVFPTLPLGTLAANVFGALLMGCALGLFAQYESVSPAIRLAVITGFLGGLTTFSTFSGETTVLLLRGEYGWAGALITLHVGGSLLATFSGIALVRVLFKTLGATT